MPDNNLPLIPLDSKRDSSQTPITPISDSGNVYLPIEGSKQTEYDRVKNDNTGFLGYGDKTDLLHEDQSSLEVAARVSAKFALNTLTNVAGGIAGGINGIGAFIGEAWDADKDGKYLELNKLWNNSTFELANKISDDINSSEALRVYKSSHYDEYNFFKSMTEMGSFMDEVQQGASFVAGAVIQAMLLNEVGAAVSFGRAANISRAVQGTTKLNLMSSIGTEAASAVAKAGTSSFSLQGSGAFFGNLGKTLFMGIHEAGIESYGAALSVREKLLQDFAVENGRRPNDEERAAIEERVMNAGNFTWAANTAIQGIGNYVQFKGLITGKWGNQTDEILNSGRKKAGAAAQKKMVSEEVEGTSKSILDKTAEKFAKTKVGKLTNRVSPTISSILGASKGMFTEGLEEYAQNAVSTNALEYYGRNLKDESKDFIGNAVLKTLSNFENGLGDNAVMKEAWMGVLLGGGSQAVEYLASRKANQKEQAQLDAETDKIFQALKSNPTLLKAAKADMESAMKAAGTSKEDADVSKAFGDKFEFKNQEDDAIHSFIAPRIKYGLKDVVLNQIKDLRDMTIEDFHNTFFGKDNTSVEKNESTREKVIDKLTKRVETIDKLHKAISAKAKLKGIKPEVFDAYVDSMVYSASMLDSLNSRESDLTREVLEDTGGHFLTSVKGMVEEVLRPQRKFYKEFSASGLNFADFKAKKEQEAYEAYAKLADPNALDDINKKHTDSKTGKVNVSNALVDIEVDINKNTGGIDYNAYKEKYKALQNDHYKQQFFDDLQKISVSDPLKKDRIEQNVVDLFRISNLKESFIDNLNLLNNQSSGEFQDFFSNYVTNTELKTEEGKEEGEKEEEKEEGEEELVDNKEEPSEETSSKPISEKLQNEIFEEVYEEEKDKKEEGKEEVPGSLPQQELAEQPQTTPLEGIWLEFTSKFNTTDNNGIVSRNPTIEDFVNFLKENGFKEETIEKITSLYVLSNAIEKPSTGKDSYKFGGKEAQRTSNVIRQSYEGTNSSMTDASRFIGNSFDRFLRLFLSSNLSDSEYIDYLKQFLTKKVDKDGNQRFYGTLELQEVLDDLKAFRNSLLERGEVPVIPGNSDLAISHAKGEVAGTVDLLTVDIDGNFRLYDFKTMRGKIDGVFIPSTVEHKGSVAYDAKDSSNPSLLSKRENHQDQLSVYAIMLESLGINVLEGFVVPLHVTYPGTSSNKNAANPKAEYAGGANQLIKLPLKQEVSIKLPRLAKQTNSDTSVVVVSKDGFKYPDGTDIDTTSTSKAKQARVVADPTKALTNLMMMGNSSFNGVNQKEFQDMLEDMRDELEDSYITIEEKEYKSNGKVVKGLFAVVVDEDGNPIVNKSGKQIIVGVSEASEKSTNGFPKFTENQLDNYLSLDDPNYFELSETEKIKKRSVLIKDLLDKHKAFLETVQETIKTKGKTNKIKVNIRQGSLLETSNDDNSWVTNLKDKLGNSLEDYEYFILDETNFKEYSQIGNKGDLILKHTPSGKAVRVVKTMNNNNPITLVIQSLKHIGSNKGKNNLYNAKEETIKDFIAKIGDFYRKTDDRDGEYSFDYSVKNKKDSFEIEVNVGNSAVKIEVTHDELSNNTIESILEKFKDAINLIDQSIVSNDVKVNLSKDSLESVGTYKTFVFNPSTQLMEEVVYTNYFEYLLENDLININTKKEAPHELRSVNSSLNFNYPAVNKKSSVKKSSSSGSSTTTESSNEEDTKKKEAEENKESKSEVSKTPQKRVVRKIKNRTKGNTLKGRIKPWELKALQKILPNLTLRQLELISANSWGYYDGAINLFSDAVEGTAFHEAFHAVFDLAFSEQEQLEILQQVQKERGTSYNLSTEEGRLALEEELSDDLAEYALGRSQESYPAKIWRIIKEFLMRISLFKNLFKDPKARTLFSNIMGGKYSHIQTPSFKKNVKYKKKDNYKLHPDFRIKVVDKVMSDLFIGTSEDATTLHDKMLLGKVNISKLVKGIIDSYEDEIKAIENYNYNLSTEEGIELREQDLLKKKSLSVIVENKDEALSLVKDHLKELGLKLVVNKDNEEELDVLDSSLEDETSEEDKQASGKNHWITKSIEVKGSKKASSIVKLFLSSIPSIDSDGLVMLDGDSFLESRESFRELFSMITDIIKGSRSEKDFYSKLKEESKRLPYLSVVIERLGLQAYIEGKPLTAGQLNTITHFTRAFIKTHNKHLSHNPDSKNSLTSGKTKNKTVSTAIAKTRSRLRDNALKTGLLKRINDTYLIDNSVFKPYYDSVTAIKKYTKTRYDGKTSKKLVNDTLEVLDLLGFKNLTVDDLKNTDMVGSLKHLLKDLESYTKNEKRKLVVPREDFVSAVLGSRDISDLTPTELESYKKELAANSDEFTQISNDIFDLSNKVSTKHISDLVKTYTKIMPSTVESSVKTLEGKRNFTASTATYFSAVVDDIANAKSIKDLIERRPDLEYAIPYSLILKKGGVLFDESGNKRSYDISKEDITQNLELYIHNGIEASSISDEPTPFSKLDKSTRFALQISGIVNNTFHVQRPADNAQEKVLFIPFSEEASKKEFFKDYINNFINYAKKLNDDALALKKLGIESKGFEKGYKQFKEDFIDKGPDKISEYLIDKFVKDLEDNGFLVITKNNAFISSKNKVDNSALAPLSAYLSKAINNFRKEEIDGVTQILSAEERPVTREEVKALLAPLAIKYSIASMEQNLLFFGMPFEYSSVENTAKRFGAAAGTKDYTVHSKEFVNNLNKQTNTISGGKLFKMVKGHPVMTVGILEDITVLSSIKDDTGKNMDSNEADAQGIITEDSRRALFIASGYWTPQLEMAYMFERYIVRPIIEELKGNTKHQELLKTNPEAARKEFLDLVSEDEYTITKDNYYGSLLEGTVIDVKLISNQGFFSSAIKPQYFGKVAGINKYNEEKGTYESVKTDVPFATILKTSLYKGSRYLSYGKNLDKVIVEMEKSGTSIKTFESAVKFGNITYNGKNSQAYTEEGDVDSKDNVTQDLYLKDIGIQVSLSPDRKFEQTSGTQTNKVLPTVITNNGKAVEGMTLENPLTGEKDIPAERVLNDYVKANKAKLQKLMFKFLKANGIKSDVVLNEKTGVVHFDYTVDPENIQKLVDKLAVSAENLGYDKNFVDSIYNLIETKNGLSYIVNKQQLEYVIYSMFNKGFLQPKTRGASMVQVANTFFEPLGTRRSKEGKYRTSGDLKITRNQDGKIIGTEVYLPSIFKDLLQGIDLEKIDSNLLLAFGFRIPTQALGSLEFIKIKGFLPSTEGDIVVVPSDLPAKSGGDFDVDKLNMYFLDYYVDNEAREYNKTVTDGKYKKELLAVPYFTEYSQEWLDYMNKYAPEELGYIVDMVQSDNLEEAFEFFGHEFMNTQKGLENRLKGIYFTMAGSSSTFEDMNRSIDTGVLKELSEEVSNKAKSSFLDLYTLGYQASKGVEMLDAVEATGVAASHQAGHSIAQAYGLKLADRMSSTFDVFENLNRDNGVVTLSGNKDFEGKNSIVGVISEYLTGYVDAAKDTYVFLINAGFRFASQHITLLRMGMPVRQVVYFMKNPLIEHGNVRLNPGENSYSSNKELLKANIQVYLNTSYDKHYKSSYVGNQITEEYKDLNNEYSSMDPKTLRETLDSLLSKSLENSDKITVLLSSIKGPARTAVSKYIKEKYKIEKSIFPKDKKTSIINYQIGLLSDLKIIDKAKAESVFRSPTKEEKEAAKNAKGLHFKIDDSLEDSIVENYVKSEEFFESNKIDSLLENASKKLAMGKVDELTYNEKSALIYAKTNIYSRLELLSRKLAKLNGVLSTDSKGFKGTNTAVKDQLQAIEDIENDFREDEDGNITELTFDLKDINNLFYGNSYTAAPISTLVGTEGVSSLLFPIEYTEKYKQVVSGFKYLMSSINKKMTDIKSPYVVKLYRSGKNTEQKTKLVNKFYNYFIGRTIANNSLNIGLDKNIKVYGNEKDLNKVPNELYDLFTDPKYADNKIVNDLKTVFKVELISNKSPLLGLDSVSITSDYSEFSKGAKDVVEKGIRIVYRALRSADPKIEDTIKRLYAFSFLQAGLTDSSNFNLTRLYPQDFQNKALGELPLENDMKDASSLNYFSLDTGVGVVTLKLEADPKSGSTSKPKVSVEKQIKIIHSNIEEFYDASNGSIIEVSHTKKISGGSSIVDKKYVRIESIEKEDGEREFVLHVHNQSIEAAIPSKNVITKRVQNYRSQGIYLLNSGAINVLEKVRSGEIIYDKGENLYTYKGNNYELETLEAILVAEKEEVKNKLIESSKKQKVVVKDVDGIVISETIGGNEVEVKEESKKKEVKPKKVKSTKLDITDDLVKFKEGIIKEAEKLAGEDPNNKIMVLAFISDLELADTKDEIIKLLQTLKEDIC